MYTERIKTLYEVARMMLQFLLAVGTYFCFADTSSLNVCACVNMDGTGGDYAE